MCSPQANLQTEALSASPSPTTPKTYMRMYTSTTSSSSSL